MPQDMVSYFARLNQKQLLIETEKAISESNLHAMHLELVAMRVELNDLEAVSAPSFLRFCLAGWTAHRAPLPSLLPFDHPSSLSSFSSSISCNFLNYIVERTLIPFPLSPFRLNFSSLRSCSHSSLSISSYPPSLQCPALHIISTHSTHSPPFIRSSQ